MAVNWQSLIRAIQGNFDHLMATVKDIGRAHNLLVDDLNDQTTRLDETNIVVDGKLNIEDAVTDHGALTGLGDDDHPQYLTPAEHTSVGTSSPHHVEDHDHDGTPTQKLLAANTHESPSPDTHHAEVHDIDGADHNGFPGDASKFLDGSGVFSTPAGGGSSGQTVFIPLYEDPPEPWPPIPGGKGDTGTPGADGSSGSSVVGPPGADGEAGGGDFVQPPGHKKKTTTYNWMSKPQPLVGAGRSFYAPRAGYILFCYAYCDTAPTSTMTVSFKINGTTAFPSSAKPTITAGLNVSTSDAYPDTKRVEKRDKITPYIDNRGGVTADRICLAIVIEEDLV